MMRRVAVALVVASSLALGAIAGAAPGSSGPNPADPAAHGPLLVKHERIAVPQRGSLEVVLPAAPAAAARPVVLLVHGWALAPVLYESWADHLASRGFAVALFDQASLYESDLVRWLTAARASLDALVAANGDPANPLFGQLDATRVAALGHSYGGATAMALAASDPRVSVVAALAPGANWPMRDAFLRYASALAKPLVVVAAEHDAFTPTDAWGRPGFAATRSSERLFVELTGSEHLNFADLNLRYAPLAPDEQRARARRYATAWLETKLCGAPDPDGWTDGRMAASKLAQGELTRVLR